MNNLKQIRELYGATQEQIAQAINVNRVTVANWENGTSVASSSNQEKLSMYYNIGPEYFYEKELDEVAKKNVTDASARAHELTEKSLPIHTFVWIASAKIHNIPSRFLVNVYTVDPVQ